MQFLVEHDWMIFISLEIAALIFLLLFVVVRYLLSMRQLSQLFLGLFLLMMVFEAMLAYFVYQVTGEVSTFQIVIIIFLLYAVTFGISDFKNLDYKARVRIGKWRNVPLVTDEEVERMQKRKHPKVIGKKSRRWFYAHTIIFGIALVYFWQSYGSTEHGFLYFIQDFAWFGDETLPQPFTSEMLSQAIRLWIIIYIIDTIINWSYTFFPDKKESGSVS